MIIIKPHALSRRDGRVILEAPVANCAATDRIWFSVDEAHADHLGSVGPEAFVLAILPVALEAGQSVSVEAPLSTKFHYNLTNYVIPLLVQISLRFRRIQIIPAEVAPQRGSVGVGVATPVSGGIDSFSTLADHHFGSVAPEYRLTHLTYHNVGSHGRGAAGDRVFADRVRTMALIAAELGLPLVTIDSNLHYFVRHTFHETHTVRQLAAAHVMGGTFGKFLFSTGVGYGDVGISPGEAIGHADPALVHLLSTERLECISAGAQYSRVQKTQRVSELELSHRMLDVCIEPDQAPTGMPNCSRCKKCVRTMLTLQILGKLHLYDRVFDLDGWRRDGRQRVGRIIGFGDSYAREILQLAREQGYRFAPSTSVRAAAWRLAYRAAALRQRYRPSRRHAEST